MPTLQERANRAANRGVSYYTPTRPVRPSGTIANSGTAQRVLQGGGRGQQPSWAGFSAAPAQTQQMQLPSYRPPEQPGQGRTSLDDILDSLQPPGQQTEQPEEPGGWRGVLGTVVNSWPAKAIMAPLNVLDVPRRLVVSTVNEVADAFNGGNASWGDWFDQVKDPNFGFGDVVGSTGNIWADRFIGFAGDVLLDPLTYVAGAGVFSGTGRAARQRLASLAVSEGLSEDVVRSIGRLGLSGIDDATRSRLRQAATRLGEDIGEPILDRGYYLKVPFRDSFHRIPGTRVLDDTISPVFAHGRARLAESRLGTTLRNRVRTPEIMREATEKLITGRGGAHNLSFEDAAGIYIYNNAQRRLGNTAAKRFEGEAARLLSDTSKRQLNGMIETAETAGGTVLNGLFNRAAKFMQDAGISFYPRKNYVPHILTQGAVEWFRGDSKLANAFRQALIPGLDLDHLSPRLLERHLLAGTVAEIGLEGEKRAFNAGAGTIAAINAEFARVFPEMKFKLFDDDIESIFKVYSQHLGDDIGRAGGLKTLLNSKSRLVRLRSDEDMVKTLIDEESLDLLNKQTADMLRSDHRSLTDRITRLQQEQVNDTTGLQGVLGVYLRDTIDDLQNVESGLKRELDDLIAEEIERSNYAARRSITGQAPDSNIPLLEGKLNDAYTRLEARAMAAETRLADLQTKAAAEAIAWQHLQRIAGMDVGMMTVPETFKALRMWNVAAAEAASIQMDRAAVSELRNQLDTLARKAGLAEAAAQNPAQIGLHAGLDLFPEQQVPPSLRLGPDGAILEYTGPSAGPRGAREAAEAPLQARAMLEYEGQLNRYNDAMQDYKLQVKDWNKRARRHRQRGGSTSDPAWKRQNPKPKKPKPPGQEAYDQAMKVYNKDLRKWNKDVAAWEKNREKNLDLGVPRPVKPIKPKPPGAPSPQRRVTVATNRIRWDANGEIHEIVSHANFDRQKAILDLVNLSIAPAQAKRAGLEASLLPMGEEAHLLGQYQGARDRLLNDPMVQMAEHARAELPRVEADLTRAQEELRTLPRTMPSEQQAQALADASERIQRETRPGLDSVWKVADGKIVFKDKAAGALDLYDRYARLSKGGRVTRTTEQLKVQIAKAMSIPGIAPDEALVRARRLAEQRQSLQRDLDLISRGPNARLKQNPVRVRLEEQVADLKDVQRRLTAVRDNPQAKRLQDEFDELHGRVEQQRNNYQQLQQHRTPDNTTTVLLEMNQDVLNKQAHLADEERRLERMADLHQRNIDEAEERVEGALNQLHDLQRALAESRDHLTDTSIQYRIRRHQDGELHAAKQAFEAAQKPVTAARRRRDAAKDALAEAKEALATSKWTPPEVGSVISRINSVEASQVRAARAASVPRSKTEWRIFPEIDAPPRRAAYTYEQRDRLAELYEIVNNTHPVDKAGAGGSYLVRQARETIARVADAGGPGGPRDVDALNEAYRVIAAQRSGGLNTAAHERYRAALKEINDIERSVAETPSYAQAEFAEVARISDMVDDLEELRTPLPTPGKGSKKYKAVAGSPRGPGGPRDTFGRAVENLELATDWIDNFSQDLVDTGAIEDTAVEFITRQRDEVERLKEAYKLRKTPDNQGLLRQASQDLGRTVDIMLSYKAALGANYEPSPQLGALIAVHRYMRERNTLDENIDTIEGLLRLSPEDRSQKFRQQITDLESKIRQEQEKVDDPTLDPLLRKRAANRRDNARRQLGKKTDAGVPQPGTGDMRGVVEDDIDSMVSLVDEAVTEFESASEDLRAVRGWRDVYLEPIERKERLKANTGRYDLQIEEMELARKRLQTAVLRAKRAGRDTVSYTHTESRSFVKTITEVEALIDSGTLDERMIPVLQNELRIARRRQAAAEVRTVESGVPLARGGVRKSKYRYVDVRNERGQVIRQEYQEIPGTVSTTTDKPLVAERKIKYSLPGRARKRGEMSLEDAEAELARYPEYQETLKRAQYKNQMDLEQMDGRAHQRITTLEMLLHDLEAPLNDNGIQQLKVRAREIDQTARNRPGKKGMQLSQKRTAEEQNEIDLIAARIEQSTNPPDEARTAAMREELEYRTGRRDEYERTMAYDYELMGHVENNGYRLLRELTENMRAPTEKEARLLRQILGGESGTEVREILSALDDYLGERVIMGETIDEFGKATPTVLQTIKTNKGYVTEERMNQAIQTVAELAKSRRLGDDALDRLLPSDQAGRALNLDEMSRAAQTSADIEMVLAGGGRRTQKTVDAEGFRENFFQTLIEEARVRRQDAENEIKTLVGWLDMNVGEDIFSVIGMVNKYFGGKLRNFTKKERAAMRKARQPIPNLVQRRKQAIRDAIVEAMQTKGYDPAKSLERRLREAKTLRSRLNVRIRGLGLVVADAMDEQFYSPALGRFIDLPDQENAVDELLRWWDKAALGQMGTVSSLAELSRTLQPADDITRLATAHRTALTREINKARKAGDNELADALTAELDTIKQGRYLPTAEETAAAAAVPEPAAPPPAPKRRRKAEPSEVAANKITPEDTEQLATLRTQLEGTTAKFQDLDHQVQSLNDQVNAIDIAVTQSERPAIASGATGEQVIRDLEALAKESRAGIPKDKYSQADLELAMARSAWLQENIPDDLPDNAPEWAELDRLSEEVARISENVISNRGLSKKAKAISKNLPMGGAQAEALAPDQQAAMIAERTALRAQLKDAEKELSDMSAYRTGLQQQIDDLDQAHAAREATDPEMETPSMTEDPIGAAQAEGLPPEGMSPETAPTHLVEDHIFDSDASPEDMLREYDSVVAQSRHLLDQYGSYKNMPPDARRTAGELANRANAISNRRQESFAAATKGFNEADESRLISGVQSKAQAANPRIDLDWWTTVSTGTPPAGASTRLMKFTGVGPRRTRQGRIKDVLRTSVSREDLPRRGAGGSMYRHSLSSRAEVLGGRHTPRTKVRVTNPKWGQRGQKKYIMQQIDSRELTRFERKARQVGEYNNAARDLSGIAERTRAEMAPIAEDIAAREADLATREAAFTQRLADFGEDAMQTRADDLADQQLRLNHANDEVAQAQRHVQRIEGQRERINDAYTRALETENVALGSVRRRAIEVHLDHTAAARELALMKGAMRDPSKVGLRSIWGDVRDLLEYKRQMPPPVPLQEMREQHRAAFAAYKRAQVQGAPPEEIARLRSIEREAKAMLNATRTQAAAPVPGAIPMGPIGSKPGAIEVSSLQPEVRQIEAMLAAAIDQQDQIDAMGLHAGVIAKRLKDFDRAPKKDAFFTPEQMMSMSPQDQARFGVRQGTAAEVTKGAVSHEASTNNEVFVQMVADGWQPVAEDMFTGADALVISKNLQTAMDNIRRTIREPGFWKVIEKYTAFFSTYATARPGFHVRNAMSGTFMNMVDGVKMREMRRAPGIWRDFMRDPEAFWARTGPEAEQLKQAFTAVFGSGAGGGFSERGLTEAVTTGGKIYRGIMNNWITRMNRKAGAYVEGPMRLAMAMDSINRGMSVDAALDRITKFHFDYTQLSELDVVARRMIPFWTFMSRNLPLQIEQMWLRPRTYLQYQSLVRNFGEEMNPFTPDYWLSQGAFTMDENAKEGEPWYLAPDLPHLRVAEPLTALSQGDLGRGLLSDVNPLFLAPFEAYAAGKKMYTGAPIDEMPRAPQGAGEALLSLLPMLGMDTPSGGRAVNPQAMHVANSMLPPIELLNRLLPNQEGQAGVREGRESETWARMFGAPVYHLTEGVQNQTRRTNRYERMNERDRQAELARL